MCSRCTCAGLRVVSRRTYGRYKPGDGGKNFHCWFHLLAGGDGVVSLTARRSHGGDNSLRTKARKGVLKLPGCSRPSNPCCPSPARSLTLKPLSLLATISHSPPWWLPWLLTASLALPRCILHVGTSLFQLIVDESIQLKP